jgi:hypothetical protein
MEKQDVKRFIAETMYFEGGSDEGFTALSMLRSESANRSKHQQLPPPQSVNNMLNPKKH